jgi:hypothetical protein
MGQMLPKAKGKLVTHEAEMPDWASAVLEPQCRTVTGLRLLREAVIAETNGDLPLRSLRVRYLDFVFVEVCQIIRIPLVGK